jgi:ribonuclease BN (tRNA processing enzyme)
MLRTILAGVLVVSGVASGAAAQTCAGTPVAVQILGSGNPSANPDRASSAYLLWVGQQARLMVDAGGGTYLRFSQSRAKLADLALLAVSHLHPDHTSDLAALMWGSNRQRSADLPIVGPSGSAVAPDIATFLARQFDSRNGAFQVLGQVLGAEQPNSARPRLDISVVDVGKSEPTTVLDRDGLVVTARGIPHSLPTLAYRVQTGGVSAVFSSDQTGTDPAFIDFAKGADVMVMHMNLAAGAPLDPAHATPAVVGRVARAAGVRRLIVSHIGQFDVDAAVAELKQAYTGPLTVGADLQCIQAR